MLFRSLSFLHGITMFTAVLPFMVSAAAEHCDIVVPLSTAKQPNFILTTWITVRTTLTVLSTKYSTVSITQTVTASPAGSTVVTSTSTHLAPPGFTNVVDSVGLVNGSWNGIDCPGGTIVDGTVCQCYKTCTPPTQLAFERPAEFLTEEMLFDVMEYDRPAASSRFSPLFVTCPRAWPVTES